jgi:hypothetical protein
VANPPAVSVVIPLYNKRSTIERSLSSVFAQTFGDFEVVVVDDGSQDGSAEFVAERFVDSRLRLHRQTNAGPGAARNAGLALSRGALITFLDADDDWRPSFLEVATTTLARYSEIGAFTAAFDVGATAVNRWDELRRHGFSEGEWRLTPQTPHWELPFCQAAFSSSSVVYRREAIEPYGGFYTRNRCTLGEDVYLWIQILLNHAIYRHMEPLAHYHTEDSELGIGARIGSLPLEPAMTDPAPIRAACPQALHETLELWLAQQALRAAFIQLGRGDAANAAVLLRSFPAMRGLGGDYLKLRLRLASPTLWDAMRRLVGGPKRG